MSRAGPSRSAWVALGGGTGVVTVLGVSADTF